MVDRRLPNNLYDDMPPSVEHGILGQAKYPVKSRVRRLMLIALLAPLMCQNTFAANNILASFASLSNRLSRYERSGNVQSYKATDFIRDWSRFPSGKNTLAYSTPEDFSKLPVRVHRSEIILQLKPGTSPETVDKLLSRLQEKYGVQIIDSVPAIGVVILKVKPREDTSSVTLGDDILNSIPRTERESALQSSKIAELLVPLREEPEIATASQNTLIGLSVLPPSSSAHGFDNRRRVYAWDWGDQSDTNTPSSQKLDGNWGLKYANFPSAWNFRQSVIRRNGNDPQILIGIIDAGFGPHTNLRVELSSISQASANDHGYHVCGIIGASWNAPLGIDGCTPDCHIIGATLQTIPTSGNTRMPLIMFPITDLLAMVTKFVLEYPTVKVINLSLGYNWTANENVIPAKEPQIQDIVITQGKIFRTIAAIAEANNIIIVSAAGNDSESGKPLDAQWASPFNWAAMNPGDYPTPARNIIVVESIKRDGTPSDFSNIHGNLSAPGEEILSTVASANPFRDLDEPMKPSATNYAVFDGTSMAAPFVTGLIGLMYSYNPNLSLNDVLDILEVRNANRPASKTPAPTINAFKALLACRKDSLKDLADLNGDGHVDMADFAIFKSHLAQVEGRGGTNDLNGDGIVSANENVFPRCDLNGSGRLSQHVDDKRLINGKLMSDFDVLKAAWDSEVPPPTEQDLLK
jgi:subtilisin family serine protease